MIPLIYEKNEKNFDTLGLGYLPSWIECSVVEERNGAFYLAGELPIDGLHVDEIAYDRIILAAPAPQKPAQPFRIFGIDKGEPDTIKILAYHVSYQLTEAVNLPLSGGNPPTFSTAQDAIEYIFHYSRPIMEGVFTPVSDISAGTRVPIDIKDVVSVRAAIGGTEGGVIDGFGGELEWDFWNVRLHARRGADTDRKLIYGKNLESMTFEGSLEGLVTAYAGYVRGEGYTIIGSLIDLGNAPFAYPRVETIDLTETFKDADHIPNIQEIDAATRNAMGGRKEPRASYTTKAVPDDLQDLYLTDSLMLVYPNIHFDQRVKIVRVVFHPIIEKYTEITVGEIRTSIIDTIAALQKGTAL